ncbi:MAG: glycosyltransferase [Candidatus Eutrophobiaceae bacterium]
MCNTAFILPGLVIWLGILLLPWRPWSCRESLDAAPALAAKLTDLSDITVLIPARNEATHIGATLAGLKAQGTLGGVILIDDQSDDDTADVARQSGLGGLHIISGSLPPAGWSGKLWALEQGLQKVHTQYALLLDADIVLQSALLPSLLDKLETDNLDMASLMVTLRMQTFWERMLLPAFVFFFKLLYPFRLVNHARIPMVAAAAGGIILIRKRVLDDLGGFASLKGALIDDCSLAAKAKALGGRIWIGLSHDARSIRRQDGLSPILRMVRRTAYSQLRFSPMLLLLCTLLMAAAFPLPLLGLAYCVVMGEPLHGAWAAATLFIMLAVYAPTVQYYRLPLLCLPGILIAGIAFLIASWHSALDYHFGQGAEWKGRRYP